jgi:hypothetical protein
MDDLNPHVFVTEDYGATWTRIVNGLGAEEPVHVIREGTKNADLLLLGTEFGLHFSFDRGKSWTRFKSNFPTVPVHDIRIQPREMDAVLGTHGRSIWTVNISGLEELTPENLAKDAHLAKPQNVYLMNTRGGQQDAWDGDRVWVARNTQPGTDICYYLKADGTGSSTVTISDAGGTQIAQLTGGVKAGMNVVRWRVTGRRLAPGDYKVSLKVADKEFTTTVHVETATDQSPE